MTDYNLSQEFNDLQPIDKMLTLEMIVEDLKENIQDILRACSEDRTKTMIASQKLCRALGMIESAIEDIL